MGLRWRPTAEGSMVGGCTGLWKLKKHVEINVTCHHFFSRNVKNKCSAWILGFGLQVKTNTRECNWPPLKSKSWKGFSETKSQFVFFLNKTLNSFVQTFIQFPMNHPIWDHKNLSLLCFRKSEAKAGGEVCHTWCHMSSHKSVYFWITKRYCTCQVFLQRKSWWEN